jgi:hypothetical protein
MTTMDDLAAVYHALRVCLTEARTDTRVQTLTKAVKAMNRLEDKLDKNT